MSTQTSNAIPLNFCSGTVRMVVQGGAPWFVLDDLRSALGIDGFVKPADGLYDDEKTVAEVGTDDGRRRVVVVNLSGLYAVIENGHPVLKGRFRQWITAEVLPSILPRGSATVLPPRPAGAMHSTSEIADSLGIHASPLGKRVKHLKTGAHGEWHPAVGAASEAVVHRWWWNEAGRDAVLREFGARNAEVIR